MPIRVFAIDPGFTIGYALMESPCRLVLSGQTHNPEDVKELLLEHRPDEVVIERFRPYPGMARWLGFRAVRPVEIIQDIRQFCEDQGFVLLEQSSAQISPEGTFSDLILRQLKVYQRGKPHANDAIRHALYRLWVGHGFSRDADVADRLRAILAEVVPTDAED